MNTETLKLFITVAETGSFSKAEAQSFISKQAIMKQMNNLEEEVGCPLMVRQRSGIHLTEAGQRFYTGTIRLLHETDALISACRSIAGTDKIRIGSVEHQVLLDPVNEAFKKLYPNISLVKIAHPEHSGEYRIANDIMDVGESFIIDETPHNYNYSYTKLTNVPYCAAMDPNHPLAHKTTVSLKELSDYETVIMPLMIMRTYIQEIRMAFQNKKENLIESDAVDEQVRTAFECIHTKRIFITANPFASTVDHLKLVLLDTGWQREYGIIYRSPVSHVIRKYIDVALSVYHQ